MKKIKLLSIVALSGAILFGGKASDYKANVNFQEPLARGQSTGTMADLVIDSKKAIHGLQFDITYNPSEIQSIIPQSIDNFEVKFNELSDGLIRGLIFSLQGLVLPGNLSFEFVNAAWPNWSYADLFSLSFKTSYASLTSLNLFSAALSFGFLSG